MKSIPGLRAGEQSSLAKWNVFIPSSLIYYASMNIELRSRGWISKQNLNCLAKQVLVMFCLPDFNKLVETLRDSHVHVLGDSLKRQVRLSQIDSRDSLWPLPTASPKHRSAERRLHLTTLNRTLKVTWSLVTRSQYMRGNAYSYRLMPIRIHVRMYICI